MVREPTLLLAAIVAAALGTNQTPWLWRGINGTFCPFFNHTPRRQAIR